MRVIRIHQAIPAPLTHLHTPTLNTAPPTLSYCAVALPLSPTDPRRCRRFPAFSATPMRRR
eukprot:238402-Chlamydomonas_euryale.AAC.1